MNLENNKICKIVQDLMPSYVEDLLNNESKLFVDEHISNCNNCKSYLDAISQNISDENKEKEETNNLEIDSLKKYRKKIIILKRLLLTILIVIILIIISLFVRYKYHEYILNSALEKFEELENSENFHINRKTIYINYSNNVKDEDNYDIYYKDGRYKRVHDYCIMYGQINSKNYLEIFHETKTIENREANCVPYTKKELVCIYTLMYNYNISNKPKNEKLKQYTLNTITIRKDKYMGRECYVVRTNSSSKGYGEYWIDSETKYILRDISEEYGVYYMENIFTLTLNQTQDEDIEVSNLEQYSDYTYKDVTITKDIMEEWRENIG